MSKIPTHYDTLNLTSDAPEELIRAAYKTLVQHYHPEKFSGQEEEALELVEKIKESYDILINPASRAEHDSWIVAQEELAIRHSQWLFDTTLENALQNSYQDLINSNSSTLELIHNPDDIDENDNNVFFHAIGKRFFTRVSKITVICLVILIAMLCLENNEINQNLASLKSLSMELLKPMIILDHHS